MMAEQAMSSSQGFCNRLKRDDAVMADCGSHRSKKSYFFIFKTCNLGCTGKESDEKKEVQMIKLQISEFLLREQLIGWKIIEFLK